jgi:hypothetical protein
MICTDGEGMLGVDYVSIIPVLIEAIKSIQLENEVLKGRMISLEQRL